MKNLLIFTISLMGFHYTADAQESLELYGKGAPIPNAKPCVNKESYAVNNDGIGIVSFVTRPTLSVYLPKTPNKAHSAVIICPGGGYSILASDHEGKDVAKALNEWGIAAFVLKYRIPDSACMTNKENVPLMDAEQAIKVVRENALKWKVDVSKVGILGFSAGGHLASSLSTHYNEQLISNPNGISLRPDFTVLAYPVISFRDSVAHIGSRDNLIGKNPPSALINHFSNEEQVNSQTPPAFLVHALDDDLVPAANSIRFVEALHKNKVKAELHLYQAGGHGFGMHNKTTKDEWMQRLKNWLASNQFLQ